MRPYTDEELAKCERDRADYLASSRDSRIRALARAVADGFPVRPLRMAFASTRMERWAIRAGVPLRQAYAMRRGWRPSRLHRIDDDPLVGRAKHEPAQDRDWIHCISRFCEGGTRDSFRRRDYSQWEKAHVRR